MQYLDKNADKLIYNDNTYTRNVLGSYAKILPDLDTFQGYDLANHQTVKNSKKNLPKNWSTYVASTR